VDFSDFEDEHLRTEALSFFEKRVRSEFKVNSTKGDEQSQADLDKIHAICVGL